MTNIKAPGADCENCPLQSSGTFVLGNGPSKASVVIVGEAPSTQDAKKNTAFYGPSGRLLDATLTHYQISRGDVYVTNACLCRPIDGSTPPKAAIQACRPRLLEEIKQREPKTVVTLGNVPAQSILKTTEGVTKLRVGPGHEREELPGVRIITTVHPAACLRQGDMYPHFVADIGKITHRVDPWKKPDWKAVDTPIEALKTIDALRTQTTGPLALDIEVGIEKDTAFDHPDQYDLLCIGISYAANKAIVLGENAVADKQVLQHLANLLRERGVIAQNGKFDLSGLYPLMGEIPLTFDTMLASYCLDERPGVHGLAIMGTEYLGAPDWKDVIKKYVKGKQDNYSVIPRPVLYEYNAFDVSITYALYELFSQMLEEENLRNVHDFLVEASNHLKYLELAGIKVDQNYSDELVQSYLSELEPLEKHMQKLLGDGYEEFNPRSPAQVKTAIKERMHIQIPQKRNTKGQLADSTDEETLKIMQGKVAPDSWEYDFFATILEHRRKSKLYGTYIKGIRKRMYKGRIYTNYLLHGTTSGRLASRNPNMQNIVRDTAIRKQFVADEGNIFIQADYKQAEGRVITTLAQDEYLQSIFSDPDRDLFTELGRRLYQKEKLTKDERVRVKAYFYGLAYGREAASIAQEFKISRAEAENDLQAFFNLIPATANWQKSVQQSVLNGVDLTSPFGRRRRFHLITEENKHDVLKEALSYLPQSTASDICLSALIELRPILEDMGAFIRLTIHDALVVESPVDLADQVSATMQKVMIAKGADWTSYVPFEVDVSFGPSWGDL